MTREELIERLERAIGPDRELDCDIGAWVSRDASGADITPGIHRVLARIYSDAASAPRYTSGIDAALTLVPEGLCAYVTALETGRGKAAVLSPGQQPNGLLIDARATPALALCIAALKSRPS